MLVVLRHIDMYFVIFLYLFLTAQAKSIKKHWKVAIQGGPPIVTLTGNNSYSGTAARYMGLFSERFNFQVEYVDGISPSASFGLLNKGQADAAIGVMLLDFFPMSPNLVHCGVLWIQNGFIMSRRLKPLPMYDNILKPLDLVSWVVFCGTLVLLSACIYSFHRIYLSHDYFARLIRVRNASKSTFAILLIAGITKPNAVPSWFKGFSAGQILVMSWTTLSVLMVHIYNCNLRASLIGQRYEVPIDSMEDAIENGQTIYMPSFGAYAKEIPNATEPEDLKWNRLARVLNERGGIYNPMETYGNTIPFRAIADVLENRATFMSNYESALYTYEIYPELLGIRNLRKGKEAFGIIFVTFAFPENFEHREEFTRFGQLLYSMGFYYKFMFEGLSLQALPEFQAQMAVTRELEIFTLRHFFTPYVFLLAGLSTALLTFAFEARSLIYKVRK